MNIPQQEIDKIYREIWTDKILARYKTSFNNSQSMRLGLIKLSYKVNWHFKKGPNEKAQKLSHTQIIKQISEDFEDWMNWATSIPKCKISVSNKGNGVYLLSLYDFK